MVKGNEFNTEQRGIDDVIQYARITSFSCNTTNNNNSMLPINLRRMHSIFVKWARLADGTFKNWHLLIISWSLDSYCHRWNKFTLLNQTISDRESTWSNYRRLCLHPISRNIWGADCERIPFILHARHTQNHRRQPTVGIHELQKWWASQQWLLKEGDKIQLNWELLKVKYTSVIRGEDRAKQIRPDRPSNGIERQTNSRSGRRWPSGQGLGVCTWRSRVRILPP